MWMRVIAPEILHRIMQLYKYRTSIIFSIVRVILSIVIFIPLQSFRYRFFWFSLIKDIDFFAVQNMYIESFNKFTFPAQKVTHDEEFGPIFAELSVLLWIRRSSIVGHDRFRKL